MFHWTFDTHAPKQIMVANHKSNQILPLPFLDTQVSLDTYKSKPF